MRTFCPVTIERLLDRAPTGWRIARRSPPTTIFLVAKLAIRRNSLIALWAASRCIRRYLTPGWFQPTAASDGVATKVRVETIGQLLRFNAQHGKIAVPFIISHNHKSSKLLPLKQQRQAKEMQESLPKAPKGRAFGEQREQRLKSKKQQ
jgi:hypothetical protein